MKLKNTIFFLVIFYVPILLHARLLKDCGVMVAYTSANITTDKFEDFPIRRNGFNFGIFTELFKTQLVPLIFRIEYTQKGFIRKRVELNEDGEEIQTVQANTRLDYLSIPILAKIKGVKLTTEPYIAFGPRLDILVNKKKGKFKYTTVTKEDYFADYYDNFTFGGTIAFGLSLPKIYIFKPSIELDYNFDLNDSFSTIETIIVKNNSFDIWLIFSF